MSAESPTPNREIAYRVFAAEYDDSTLSHAESDEERAPNYVITPTGARLNRLFVVGTLTEISSVNDEMLRARIVDPTGAFVVYAGQYQPDELAVLEQLEPPEFVAITGKARTFQPDDSDQVYTSIRPESIAAVDAETRDRWVVSAAEQTVDRIGAYARAAEVDAYGTELRDTLVEAGVDDPLAQGISLAQGHYGTTPTYLETLRERALETAEVIAGERDAVEEFAVRPNETSPESPSFEEVAAAAGVGVDVEDIRAAVPDTGAEEDEEGEESDTPVASTVGSASSGETGSDELLGSAEGSEPAETELSPEHSSTADAESENAEGSADSVDAAANAGLEAEDETQSSPEATADSTDSAVAESTPSDTEADRDVPVETTDADESDGDEQIEASLETDDDSSVETDEKTSVATDEATAADETESADSSTETDETLESETDSEDEDLGDFDSDGFDEGMYEMDDEEREELEAEFGAEFSTGAEVDDPGSADIDLPDDEEEPAEDADQSAAAETTSEEPASSSQDAEVADTEEPDLEETEDTETETEADTEAEPASESEDEPDEDVDVQAQVIETMNQLDDGDGADRSTVVSEVVDETGAAPDDVEDAIQDALMGGQCYEPDDETLKAI